MQLCFGTRKCYCPFRWSRYFCDAVCDSTNSTTLHTVVVAVCTAAHLSTAATNVGTSAAACCPPSTLVATTVTVTTIQATATIRATGAIRAIAVATTTKGRTHEVNGSALHFSARSFTSSPFCVDRHYTQGSILAWGAATTPKRDACHAVEEGVLVQPILAIGVRGHEPRQ